MRDRDRKGKGLKFLYLDPSRKRGDTILAVGDAVAGPGASYRLALNTISSTVLPRNVYSIILRWRCRVQCANPTNRIKRRIAPDPVFPRCLLREDCGGRSMVGDSRVKECFTCSYGNGAYEASRALATALENPTRRNPIPPRRCLCKWAAVGRCTGTDPSSY